MLRLGPFRWSAATPGQAVWFTASSVVPLLIGQAWGRMDLGAWAAFGAVSAGGASVASVSRSRVATTVVASVGMGVSIFVGATLAARAPWLLVPAIFIWGYVTGIAVSLGPWQSLAVLQWPLALVVMVGLPMAAGPAAVCAGLVLAGGLFQVMLIAGSWAIRPGTEERSALSDTFDALARYAADVAAGMFGPPPSAQLAAEGVLHDPNPLLATPARLILLDLLEQAERVRASLAALAARAAEAETVDEQHIRSLTGDAAGVLEMLAAALAGRAPARVASPSDLDERVATLLVPRSARWRWTGEALLGQLRAITRSLRSLEHMRLARAATRRAPPAPAGEPGDPAWNLATLRANRNLKSEAGRHALRLALVAALGQALAQATGLTEGRWVVLTIFLVLKPDYTTTVDRGVHRSAGTFLGAGLGVAAAQLAHLGPSGLIAAVTLSAAIAYAVYGVNYLLYSVFMTAYVVVLLHILGTPAAPTAEARLIATAIGSALALAAYITWPTWEGLTAQEKFARFLEVHRDYSTTLLNALADPNAADAAGLRTRQACARRARCDAEASAARLEDEPSHRNPLSPAVARSLTASFSRLGQANLVLHTLVCAPPERDGTRAAESRLADREVNGAGSGAIKALAGAVAAALTELAASIRTLRPPRSIPALRPLQASVGHRPHASDTGLAAATDAIVDAIDTIDSTLRDRLL
jgi:uncharacterized membrane protein YccC